MSAVRQALTSLENMKYGEDLNLCATGLAGIWFGYCVNIQLI